MWLSHMKIGAQAAKVPQDVPVATDNILVQTIPTTATDLPVTPKERAKFTTDAPTPELINRLAMA